MPKLYKEKQKENEMYLDLRIGRLGQINMVIVDENGEPHPRGHVITITDHGELRINEMVSPDAAARAGLKLDGDRIKLIN